MIIDNEQFDAMICIINNHIKGYYPNDMLIVENYHSSETYTSFELYRALITKGDGYTRIEGKRKVLTCACSSICLKSVRNRKILAMQLKILGLEVYA